MEKLFPEDRLSKRDRVEVARGFRPADRAAIHEQLSYNPGARMSIEGALA